MTPGEYRTRFGPSRPGRGLPPDLDALPSDLDIFEQ
jgi:hypothetical protein